MNSIFEVGNVRLLNRPTTVTEDAMYNAGWDDAEQGSDVIATVYTCAYRAGTGSDMAPYRRNIVLHMTPILANGTIKSPSALDSYVDSLLLESTDQAILSKDAAHDGLVLWIQDVESWDSEAYDLEYEFDERLHLLQEAYYGTLDISDYPTVNSLK